MSVVKELIVSKGKVLGSSGGTVDPGDITPTGVTANSYNIADITVNTFGQITAASNGVAVTALNSLTGGLTIAGGTDAVVAAAGSTITVSTEVNPAIFPYRLSANSAGPVVDGTGGSLYLYPYIGDRVALYNGTTWQTYSTASVISITTAGLTAGLPYDIFVNQVSGVPTLSAVAWTNTTTRATAPAYQNGVLVKSGSPAYRYVGTVVTVGSDFVDQAYQRYVWNYYNRIPRRMYVVETTANWNYTATAYRQANANTANQLQIVCGVSEDLIDIDLSVLVGVTTTSHNVYLGIGLDWTTGGFPDVNNMLGGQFSIPTGQFSTPFVNLRDRPIIGLHTYVWLESSDASGTTTFYGNATGARYQGSGLSATWRC